MVHQLTLVEQTLKKRAVSLMDLAVVKILERTPEAQDLWRQRSGSWSQAEVSSFVSG